MCYIFEDKNTKTSNGFHCCGISPQFKVKPFVFIVIINSMKYGFPIAKIFEKTAKKRTLFFLVSDILSIAFAVYLAFFLRFDGNIPAFYAGNHIQAMIALSIFCYIPALYFYRLYYFSWTYVSTNELISLVKAVSWGFLLLVGALFILKDYPVFGGFSRSTVFISYFLIFIFCGLSRFSKRIYLHLFNGVEGKEGKRKTLIVGAEDAGEQILRSILASNTIPYFPVGFIDDNPMKQGVMIHGLKVLGKIDDMPKIVAEKGIEEVIIALPTAGSKTIRRAVEVARKIGLRKIKVVPLITELINGEVSVRNIREVEVEDLLGRKPVSVETKAIKNFIHGKIILITGAAGSIGSELSRQVAKFNPSLLLLLDQEETGIFNISKELEYKFPHLKIMSVVADIQDKEKIGNIFDKFKPSVIFHAAAYKHVSLMEKQPEEAVKNNIFGMRTIAEAALGNHAEKFIFISTDKAINPTSIMGATKRVGEMICQVLNQKNHTKFISVRFGNVLGSRGSVVPIFKEQIKRGGPVEVTHPEMARYFMVTSEACLLVMQAAEMGQGGEVFVLDMGKPVKIIDLAKEMIRLSGFEPDKDIPIIFTQPFPGEKLFEELLTAEEGTIATKNQKIFIAKLSKMEEMKLNEGLEKLKKEIGSSDKNRIKSVLKGIIPSYKMENLIN